MDVPPAIIGLMVVTAVAVAWLIYYYLKNRKVGTDTQRILSDRDLLQRLSREPDGFLTPDRLSKTSQLTKSQARIRLQKLSMAGMVDQAYNKRLKAHYSLRHPIAEREQPVLSSDPFLTVEDLLTIFELYDYRPRDQDLIMSTGLPLALIRREMKYFSGAGIVDILHMSEGYGKQSQRIYVLVEPYRSRPEEFRSLADRCDLELRTLLRNDNFIV
ncbi:hypothetical protein [Lewinella sp. JB7]|uniref:hypothetical protein n=1 Tax=Lewinella sp. JB7 TaxID=2962887 RepID=UPI0020C97C3F|nr:hypothetical protein [Lewinella sp. JB7]MCP9235870.1 hypothetical protein [Lewinella sp. JB7]